ncbi:MAG TPA: L-threonate dehydrogenase [Opitutaceae bacterium]|jgi:3-hydroxyisobutyrate dehydrogenase
MNDHRTIGFIGLGAMGAGMAARLLSAGHRVTAYDVRTEARAGWAQLGGLWAETPARAAQDADAVILMVVDAGQVERVLFGLDGALSTLKPGSLVVVHSTVSPPYAAQLGERLVTAGCLLLDAPVSGGVVAAKNGTLSVMASGSKAAFDAAEPLLAAVAGKLHRIGDRPGLGSAVKAVNQLLAGAHIALAAEAMAFGAKAGVSTQVLYDVISSSAGNSWMFTNRVPHMLDDDFRPLSAVNLFVKDLAIVLDMARDMRFAAPMAALAHQLFLMAAATGHAQEDDASVVKVYESLTGARVARAAKL